MGFSQAAERNGPLRNPLLWAKRHRGQYKAFDQTSSISGSRAPALPTTFFITSTFQIPVVGKCASWSRRDLSLGSMYSWPKNRLWGWEAWEQTEPHSGFLSMGPPGCKSVCRSPPVSKPSSLLGCVSQEERHQQVSPTVGAAPRRLHSRSRTSGKVTPVPSTLPTTDGKQGGAARTLRRIKIKCQAEGTQRQSSTRCEKLLKSFFG